MRITKISVYRKISPYIDVTCVSDNFDPECSPRASAHEIGTGQGWLKHYPGDEIRAGKINTIGRDEGNYDMRADVLLNNGGRAAGRCEDGGLSRAGRSFELQECRLGKAQLVVIVFCR